MLEEKTITPQELQSLQEKEKQKQELGKKKTPLPLYDISPILCFVLVCLIAPLGEECVFRYIIFEIFDKKNPLAYILSGGSFIFLHWLGPAQGLLNFTTFKLLLLTYLPFTAFLIYVYRRSN
jgi:membrane protease YdiL (CAAX protease family)